MSSCWMHLQVSLVSGRFTTVSVVTSWWSSFLLVSTPNHSKGLEYLMRHPLLGCHLTSQGFNVSNGKAEALRDFLEDLANETIVLLAVQDSVATDGSNQLQPAVEALKTLGVQSPETVTFRVSHAFIGYKGNRRDDIQAVDEQKAKGQGPSVATATVNFTCAYLPEGELYE